MFKETCEIITSFVKDCNGATIFNIGSSDENYYKNRKPYIWELLLKPLGEDNLVFNVDIKKGEGIDIIADCCDMPGVQSKCCDVVLFCSSIEHIKHPELALAEIKRILKDTGFVVFSAPGVYPVHKDPIDNLLRFPDRLSWQFYLLDEWEILDYKSTTPIKANPAYNFDHLVYATVVKCRKG